MKVHLRGFDMAYAQNGQGIPLLLIHGFPLNREMWAAQIQALSNEMRVIAPDLRGHGESEAVAGNYSMEMLAEDCNALVEHLGIDQPIVVCGLSMGGYIALAYYRLYPSKVAGLILAATRAGADSAEGKQNRDKTAAKAEEEGPEAVVEGMLPKMLSMKTYEENPDLVEQARSIMEKTTTNGMVGALMGMKNRPDSTGMLEQIEVPTLILYGADDQIIPFEDVETMQDAIPDVHLRILPDAGHLLNLEQPELFNRAVLTFIENLK
jgi:pimeloyl-ACP methyl ester carboxylesterase